MRPGPLFWLQLQTLTRKPQFFVWRTTYAVFCLAALAALAALTRLNASFSGATNTQPAAWHNEFALLVFSGFCWLQLYAALIITPGWVGGALTELRQRRVIEDLFTTPVSSWELICDLFLIQTLRQAWLLMTPVPMLALVGLLGGVPWHLVEVTLVTAVSMLTWLGTLSLLTAAVCRRPRNALILVYVLFGVQLAVALYLWDRATAGFLASYAWLEPAVAVVNPAIALMQGLESFQAGAGINRTVLYGSLAWRLLWGLICLALAARWLRESHLRSVNQVHRRSRWRDRWIWQHPGSYPLLWKEMVWDFPSLRWPTWLWFWPVVLLVSGLLTYFSGHIAPEFVALTGWASLLFVATRAATCITTEREQDTWTVLIATPLTSSEIVGGKWLGSLFQARLAVLGIVALSAAFAYGDPKRGSAALVFLGLWLIVAGTLALLGVACSLTSKRSTRAFLFTIVWFGLFSTGGCLCLPFFDSGSNPLLLATCIPMLFLAAFDSGGASLVGNVDVPLLLMCGATFYLMIGVLLYLSCLEFRQLVDQGSEK